MKWLLLAAAVFVGWWGYRRARPPRAVVVTPPPEPEPEPAPEPIAPAPAPGLELGEDRPIAADPSKQAPPDKEGT